MNTRSSGLLDGSSPQVQPRQALSFAPLLLGEQCLPLFVRAGDAHPIEGGNGILNGFLSVFLRRVREIPNIKLSVGFVFEIELIPVDSVLNTVLLGQGRAIFERGAGLACKEFDRDGTDGEQVHEGNLECIKADLVFALRGWCGCGSRGRYGGRGVGDSRARAQ